MFEARSEESDMAKNKTAIVMGAQQEIGEGLVDAVLCLSNARQGTGEVLHVDSGARGGRW
jgi:hypothetical protein